MTDSSLILREPQDFIVKKKVSHKDVINILKEIERTWEVDLFKLLRNIIADKIDGGTLRKDDVYIYFGKTLKTITIKIRKNGGKTAEMSLPKSLDILPSD